MSNLNKKEIEFIRFWEKPNSKKNFFKLQLLKGFRNGLLVATGIILCLITGWYKRVSLLSLGELIFLLFGLLLMISFIAFFSAYYFTEQGEQQYEELKHNNSNFNNEVD